MECPTTTLWEDFVRTYYTGKVFEEEKYESYAPKDGAEANPGVLEAVLACWLPNAAGEPKPDEGDPNDGAAPKEDLAPNAGDPNTGGPPNPPALNQIKNSTVD